MGWFLFPLVPLWFYSLFAEPTVGCPVKCSLSFLLELLVQCLFGLTGHLILHGILEGQEARGLYTSSHLEPSWFPAMGTQSLEM